jgi:hypothetical protein
MACASHGPTSFGEFLFCELNRNRLPWKNLALPSSANIKAARESSVHVTRPAHNRNSRTTEAKSRA